MGREVKATHKMYGIITNLQYTMSRGFSERPPLVHTLLQQKVQQEKEPLWVET